jgi:hypothetical protein
MIEQIFSINLIYFKILSFLYKDDSIELSQTNRLLNKVCKENGYLFNLIVREKKHVSFADLHQKTARCVSIYNFSKYPLTFFPSKIKLCNSLLDKVTKVNENVSEISYEHEIPMDINFKQFPNVERLHVKLRASDNPINNCILTLSKLTHLSLYHVSNVSCFGKYISSLQCLEEFYTNFSINHLNISSTNIKIVVTLGKNDSISVPVNSNLLIYSNGYGMCISDTIKNNLPDTFEHHLSTHLIPQYRWYIFNILCGIKSSQKDNFVGSFNTNVERNLDGISMYFKDETQPYYYQEDEEHIYELSDTESENYDSIYEIDYPERDDEEENMYKRRCLSWEHRDYQLCF